MRQLRETVKQQRTALGRMLELPMLYLADRAAAAWDDPARLNGDLAETLPRIPHCHLLYCLDGEGRQHGGNVAREEIDPSLHGQDLSSRPYLQDTDPDKGFRLSPVYVSRITHRPCITAIQPVVREGERLGFVAGDFDLRDLPLQDVGQAPGPRWRQIKGDPAIRSNLFLQSRVVSPMDEAMTDVIAILEELICERGVFQVNIHFSSSRATLWLLDDPYSYRLHVLDEILDPAVCLAYPAQQYSARAIVPEDQVRTILERFGELRQADDNIYLRSASLNVINGMVSLTFSCDGSHYMEYRELLEKDLDFWLGQTSEADDPDGGHPDGGKVL